MTHDTSKPADRPCTRVSKEGFKAAVVTMLKKTEEKTAKWMKWRILGKSESVIRQIGWSF